MTAISNHLIVLLAEDDENDVILIRRAFKGLDPSAHLIVTPDGEQALAYLRGAGNFSARGKWPLPDVVLLDQWMPRLTGLDVLSMLRAEPRFRSLPVAILSGGLSPALAESAERLKAASGAKAGDTKQTLKAIDHAIRAALRLVQGPGPIPNTPAAKPAAWTAAELEEIRVWT